MVRAFLCAIGFLILAGCATADNVGVPADTPPAPTAPPDITKVPPPQVAQADKIYWAGLDYSKVQMVGTGDFKDPQAIFPGILQEWNGLFISKQLGELSKKLRKPVVADIDGVSAQNLKATADQVIRKDGDRSEWVDKPNLTKEDIAAAVKAYTMKEKNGIGLVFIVERLVKTHKVACLYVVFFDLGTREILAYRRDVNRCRSAMGFRSYWFIPVKDSIGKL